MIMSYGGFAAVTPVPGVPRVTIYLTVGPTFSIIAPAVYDDSITVPQIRWGAPVGRATLPTAVVGFPPGGRVPNIIRLSAQKMPVAGEVVNLPGLSGTEAPPPPPFQPPARPPAPPPAQPAPASAPIAPAPALPPALAPVPSVPQAIPTGQATTIDVPGTGPTVVPVFVAPISSPEIVPGAGGRLVVVVPRDQLPNLPTMPIRQAVGERAADGAIQYSPEMWAAYFTFPPHGRVPLYADPVQEAAAPAGTAASPAIPGTRDVSTAAGAVDAEGRPYPAVRDVNTGASASTVIVGTPEDATMVVGENAPPSEKAKLPWGLLAAVAAGVYFVGRK